MPAELILTFPDHEHVLVSLREDHDIVGSPAQPFVSPLEAETRAELTWYLEIYAARYTTEQDDPRASRTAARLKGWGAALLDAVLTDHAARRLFNRFQDNAEPGRLISINSIHPAILAQPWELLCDSNGTFLFLENSVDFDTQAPDRSWPRAIPTRAQGQPAPVVRGVTPQ